MASFVRISGDQAEFPYLSIKYPLRPPSADLQDGLEAYRELQADPSLQSLPLEQRREVTRFLRQFGQLLFRSAFPDDIYARLDGPAPLLLELENEWRSYPWELLHDGSHWVSLHRGLLRFAAPPAAGEPEPPPLVGPLRVVAVSAAPLSVETEEEFSTAVEGAGRRFISTVGQLLEQPEGEAPPFLFRSLEHASRDALEEAVILAPHLLFFSGFAAQQGWFLESDSLGPDQVGREWLTAHLHKATRGGLRALVLKDSLALSEPEEATEQAAAFFRAGLPALVRIEGRQVRAREQDYFRALVQTLAGGASVVEGHLAGVRRMYRRFEESWDWSFNRLYLKALPRNGTTPAASPAPPRGEETTGTDSAVPETARHFLLQPPPPLFQRNRRVFGRHRELDRLAAALHPERPAPSPLVFLCGPAGSGKTALAFETARRVQRRFGQVAYLHRRDLPGEREGLALPPGLVPPEPPPAERLFAALAKQVGLRSSGDDDTGEALRLRLGEGPPSLIVVDGLENQTGYPAFCQALEKFPTNCRILLLSRGKPPLLAGSQVYLDPLEPVELEEIFDVSLPRKIAEYPFREGLE
ncbi:MAG: ATP-binding protein, partial [SAR324 cluster bacterium]|nr:ATP-binding protein [SAR324 cluster bacterium]